MKRKRNGNFVCLQKCSFQGQSQQLLEVDQVSRVWALTPETLPSSSPAAQHYLGVLVCANESIDTSPTLPSRLRRSVHKDSSPQQCNATASLPWFYFPLVTQECGQPGTRNMNNRSPKILFRLLLKQLYLLIPRAWKGIKSLTSPELLLLSC